MSYERGYDLFTPDVDAHETMFCLVCDQEMKCERNVMGYRSFTSAMGGCKERHDVFKCKNSEESWHKQVLLLKKKAKETPSKTIENLLNEEIRFILETRTPTKEI